MSDTETELVEEALSLAHEILEQPLSIQSPAKKEWQSVVLPHLSQAHEAMMALLLAVERGLRHPADVLVRYLFELSLNLLYMNDHPESVAEYLAYSRDDELPKGQWKHVKTMCEELNLMGYYETVYRITSDTAHAGPSSMRFEGTRLSGWTRMDRALLTRALTSGLTFYTWVVAINADEFPEVADAFTNYLGPDGWDARMKALDPRLLAEIQAIQRELGEELMGTHG